MQIMFLFMLLSICGGFCASGILCLNRSFPDLIIVMLDMFLTVCVLQVKVK